MTAEARAGCTIDHLERVSRWALLLTERFAPELVHDPRVEVGYLLHDIGMLGVPEQILQKPGPLDPEELVRVQAHVEIGVRLLESIPDAGPVSEIVRSHHERWDGRGYPDGLTREEIPLGARIFAVADALDAMTSHRPYRRAMSWSAAQAEIREQRKRQFDPDVVDAFVTIEPVLREIRRELAAA